MYFNKEEYSGKEECEFGYKEYNNDDDDKNKIKIRGNSGMRYLKIRLSTDPVLPLDISPLNWDTPTDPADIGSGPLLLE